MSGSEKSTDAQSWSSPRSAPETHTPETGSDLADTAAHPPGGGPEPNEGSWRSKLARIAPRGGPVQAGLYLVSTPIGHGDDITVRALDMLEAADVICCEDTRVTARLLALYGIKNSLIAYHDHNGPRMRPKILEHLAHGAVVVLVSDAGTPLISDPGYRLVCEALEADHKVVAIPGASSPLTALAVAGLPSDRFFFHGFLPPKQGARQAALRAVAAVPSTIIFFESGPRLKAALADMAHVLGPRDAAVSRELTKRFEETRRGALPDLANHYAEAPAPKGEIVVTVGPPVEDTGTEVDLDGALRDALRAQPLKVAVEQVTAATGLPRRTVYQRALTLRDEL